jgi:hypothetical protein
VFVRNFITWGGRWNFRDWEGHEDDDPAAPLDIPKWQTVRQFSVDLIFGII